MERAYKSNWSQGLCQVFKQFQNQHVRSCAHSSEFFRSKFIKHFIDWTVCHSLKKSMSLRFGKHTFSQTCKNYTMNKKPRMDQLPIKQHGWKWLVQQQQPIQVKSFRHQQICQLSSLWLLQWNYEGKFDSMTRVHILLSLIFSIV